MIRKYKKKPIEVEAVQFLATADCLPELYEWGLRFEIVYNNRNVPILRVSTITGIRLVTEGDFIIKDMRGLFSTCRADHFHETYESAETEA